MNSTPRPPTVNNYLDTQQQFTAVINTKSANFIGRDFVFTAINNFLNRYNRGYFTIIGAPGSGKSAIIAKYVKENPPENCQVIYYNAELEGKNHAEEFLTYICCQIIANFPHLSLPNLPDNATEGSWFLSLLLQQISEKLLQANQTNQPNQKLIIAIDGLNCINRNLQPPGTNIFYLPRYLPQGVYFLLSRRPFLSSNSGLLIEAPVQSLHLADYPEENKQDIQNYIQTTLNSLPFLRGVGGDLKSWLNTHQINKNANNFKYISEILTAIAEGFYTQSEQIKTSFPPALITYYQQHLAKMLDWENQDLPLAVLQVLAEQTQHISVTEIANLLDVDEFDVEEILESWFEFLEVENTSDVTVYSLYHDNFRQWLIYNHFHK
jgi:ABC-type dipeptide/oligopeptide/nickel transport system ATPase component